MPSLSAETSSVLPRTESERLYGDIQHFILSEMHRRARDIRCPHATALELYQKINLLRILDVTFQNEKTPLSISTHLNDYLMEAGMVKP